MSLKNLFISLSAVFLLGACSSETSDDLNSLVAQSSYTLQDLGGIQYEVTKVGKDFSLKGYEDKVIIFDIFATWCPPCRAAAPSLSELQKKYSKEVKIIGVLIEEDKSIAYVQRFKDSYGATYTISNAKDNQGLSRSLATVAGLDQGFGIPLMVMFYKGKFIKHYIGAVPEEMVENDILQAISK